jgi:hypothetical protein
MKNTLESIWQDLRDKRLWPVALLLLVAVVAIPVLVINPAEEPGAVQASAQPKEKVPALTPISDAARAGEGSGLSVFDKADPFLPPSAILAASRDQSTTAGPSAAASSEAGAGFGSASPASESQSSSGGGQSASPPSTGGGGDTTRDGDTSGGGTTTVKYTYVVDATFTRDGHTRHVNGMKRLEMLPSESSPLLLFLGVDSGGDNAVFLVDSTLSATGEGHCSPSEDSCGLLSLGAGSVERFSDRDGHSYRLEIDEIRKVKVSAGSAKASSRTKRAHAASPSTKRLTVPDLVDLVTVASPKGEGSSSDTDSR